MPDRSASFLSADFVFNSESSQFVRLTLYLLLKTALTYQVPRGPSGEIKNKKEWHLARTGIRHLSNQSGKASKVRCNWHR